MTQKKVICIGCPLGCEMNVTMDDGKVTAISGQSCKKGEDFAVREAIDPRRILTTTMRTGGGGLLPVKSNKPIKKELLFACMNEINKTKAKLPVNIGDVLIKDILGTGADIVSTGRIADV